MFESQGVLIWALGVSVQLVLFGDLEYVSRFHARNIEMANRTHKIGGEDQVLQWPRVASQLSSNNIPGLSS